MNAIDWYDDVPMDQSAMLTVAVKLAEEAGTPEGDAFIASVYQEALHDNS
jgi:hypothetical protein